MISKIHVPDMTHDAYNAISKFISQTSETFFIIQEEWDFTGFTYNTSALVKVYFIDSGNMDCMPRHGIFH